MFAVVQLNSGFMAVGEYLLAYALVALSAAVLLREELLRWWQLAVLAVSAVVLLLSYEALAHLGLVLLAITVARIVGVRGMGPAGPRGKRAVLVVLAVPYACAAALAVRSILHPRDPVNAANAADLLTPLRQDGQLVISTVIAVLAVGVLLIRGGSRGNVLAVVLAVASTVLLLPAVWAAPALHYLARTLAGLALFGLLCGAVLVQVVTARRSPDGPSSSHPARLAWIAPFALVCAQVVPFTVHTDGFADWTAEFEQVVVSGSGTIPVAGSGLDPRATARYGRAWTNPVVSTLLQENRDQGVILSAPAAGPASATTPEIREEHPALPVGRAFRARARARARGHGDVLPAGPATGRSRRRRPAAPCR